MLHLDSRTVDMLNPKIKQIFRSHYMDVNWSTKHKLCRRYNQRREIRMQAYRYVTKMPLQ